MDRNDRSRNLGPDDESTCADLAGNPAGCEAHARSRDVVLIGDSHLDYLGHDADRICAGVVNLAVGGSIVRDLPGQCARAVELDPDVVVLSIGTNDSNPRREVSLDEFVAALEAVFDQWQGRLVYVASPGLDLARLGTAPRFTEEAMDAYRDAALALCAERGVPAVRSHEVLAPIGVDAFCPDGLHLSAAGYDLLIAAMRDAVAAVCASDGP